MGLQNGNCDSCGEPKTTLFPIAVLDELPSGGCAMVTKYYCSSCADDMKDEADQENDTDDDSPVVPIHPYEPGPPDPDSKIMFDKDYIRVPWTRIDLKPEDMKPNDVLILRVKLTIPS